MMRVFAFICGLCIFVALSGCGGGGGTKVTPVNSPPTIDATSVTVNPTTFDLSGGACTVQARVVDPEGDPVTVQVVATTDNPNARPVEENPKEAPMIQQPAGSSTYIGAFNVPINTTGEVKVYIVEVRAQDSIGNQSLPVRAQPIAISATNIPPCPPCTPGCDVECPQ